MNLETSFAVVLDLLLKSTVLLLAGAAVLAALRKASAANRHAVSVAIFATLLLLPLTKLIAPRWSLAMEQDPVVVTRVEVPPTVPIESFPLPASAPSSEMDASPVVPEPWVIPWKTLFVATWLFGAALLMVRRLRISLQLRALARSSSPIRDEKLAAFTRELAEANGIRATVRQSALCRVPLVAGVVRPMVLLPEDAHEWSEPRMAFALCHELGHIQRRDCLTRLLGEMVCALYWLNPLVWLAARQMRLAQEQACDDLVLNAGAPADEYAGQLVDAVRSLQSDHLGAHHALAMAQPSTLETRVVAIMEPTRNRSSLSTRAAVGWSTLVMVMLSVSAAAQLRDAQKPGSIVPGSAESEASATQVAQVEIEARYLEISNEPNGLADLKKAIEAANGPANMPSDEELRKKGVTILASPRLITKSGQKAKIEIGREYRYPNDWEKDATTGAWKSKSVGTEHLGVSLEVTPTVTAEGMIDLDLTPVVTDLSDIIDLDAPQQGAKRDPTRIVPEGHRYQPVFKHYQHQARETVKSGSSVLLGVAQVDGSIAQGILHDLRKDVPQDPAKPDAEKQTRGHLVFLVTARVGKEDHNPKDAPVKEGPRPANAPVKGAAAPVNTPAKGVVVAPKKADTIPGGRVLMDIKADSFHVDADGGFLADGNVTIDSGEFIVQADTVWATRKKGSGAAAVPPAAPESGAKADWIFPKIDFREATVREITEYLVARSRQLDPKGKGVNIVLKGGRLLDEAKITLSLANVPLEEVLKYVAALANAEAVKEEFAFVLQPKAVAAAPHAAPDPVSAEAAQEKGAAWKKAEAIMLPRLSFREATLQESIEFLRAKARELDPADDPAKKGVNLVLHPPKDGKHSKITLDLQNVPLSEALRYVANLSGLEIAADDTAIVLRPKAR